MRRTLVSLVFALGLWAAAALALAWPNGRAAAQQPSPRPPLSATDQFLTAQAQPTQGGGEGGGPAATSVPATSTPAPVGRTRTATTTATNLASATAPAATITPAATATPIVIVQTVVQTVVIQVTAPAATPVPVTPTPLFDPESAIVDEAPEPGGWLWLVLGLPFAALAVALGWLSGRGFWLPGLYPERGRPRRAGRLPRRLRHD